MLVRFALSHPGEDSDPAIRAAVERLLAACNVLRPPTPIDVLLEYRRLTTVEQAELVPHHLAFKFKRTAVRLWDKLKGKVAGFLNLQERHIAVRPDLHPHRRHFLKFHEVGHDALSWHRDLFVVTSESDLRPDVRAQFEAEANAFAGHAIFQNGHMRHGYRGTRLRMSDLGGLAAQYNASLSATVRQYVSVQDIATALIIGYPEGTTGNRGIRFHSAVGNRTFLRTFGDSLLGRGFAPNHEAATVLNVPDLRVSETCIAVMDLRGDQQLLVADTLFTGYCTLTLLHVRPTRTISSARRILRRLAGA